MTDQPKAVPFVAPQRVSQDDFFRLLGEKEFALNLATREVARLRQELDELRRPREVEKAG